MIAAAIATIVGTAAAGIPVYDRISQWRRSKIDGHRSTEGGCERDMLNSPSPVIEVKITITVPSDEEHLKAVVTDVHRTLTERLMSPEEAVIVSDCLEPKSDDKP